MSLLLTSVFRPYGVDDAYGRKENKMELFHNQVTREQGVFSLRYNHRSFGLYFIAENIKMPTMVLDFPSLKHFRKELKKGYDYVGISFIAPNFIKAKKMAEVVREVSPTTKIILGGHGTQIPDVEKLIENDYVIRGEGIHQLRKLFGEDETAPIRHPVMEAADHKRIFGMPFGHSSAVVVPGVGCPNACRFCCTSHFYDKTYYPFLRTGREMYETVVELSEALHTDEFFVMDENFLKHKDRAMELLELMERDGRAFHFSIFSSAEAITAFGIENMVRLGVMYVWIGAESPYALFDKNKGIDVKGLIAEMRRNGIFVLASSILFLEHHDKANIQDDIDYAIGLSPDFTQFMQLGPMPQTQLYLEYKKQGRLREDLPYEEWHGQHRIWFRHPNFTGEESEIILRDAFRKEYQVLGPSVMRVGETMIRGLEAPVFQTQDAMLRKRYDQLRERCKAYYLAITAIKLHLPNRALKEKAAETIQMYRKHFGPRTPFHWVATGAVSFFIQTAQLKLRLGFEAHNPPTMRTFFRLAPSAYKEMKGRIQAILRNRKTWAILENNEGAGVLSLHFSGKIRAKTVAVLMKRLSERQQLSLKSVRINITPLARFNEETFEIFLEKLSRRCEDIRVYCSDAQKKHTEFFNRLVSRRVCTINTF